MTTENHASVTINDGYSEYEVESRGAELWLYVRELKGESEADDADNRFSEAFLLEPSTARLLGIALIEAARKLR